MACQPYRVTCSECDLPAQFKVAARWSDGQTEELKTYGLCCQEHLAECFRRSRERQAACRLVPGEILEPPGIFERGTGPQQRRVDLEAGLA